LARGAAIANELPRAVIAAKITRIDKRKVIAGSDFDGDRFRVAATIPSLLVPTLVKRMREDCMASSSRNLVILLLFLAFASCAFAEDRKADQDTALPSSPATRTGEANLTGKERLGPKWSDEQRIDNCKVPLDKRGSKPRPSACASDQPS
jgi:hypothetical protein